MKIATETDGQKKLIETQAQIVANSPQLSQP